MRRYLVCVSLANLLLLSSWFELLQLRAAFPIAPSSPAFIALFEASVINVVLGSAILSCLTFLVLRAGLNWLTTLAQCIFLILCTFPLDRLCWIIFDQLRSRVPIPLMQGVWVAVLLTPILGCVLLAIYSNRIILRVAVAALTILSPAFLLTAGSLLWSIRRAPHEVRPQLAQADPRMPSRRLVWVIFDELDQRLVFEKRPEGFKLPQLDRLRAESLYATAASSPAGGTSESLPALLTGTWPVDHRELKGRTVFTEVHEHGWNSTIVGSYLPYCADMAQDVVQCVEPTADVHISQDPWAIVKKQWLDEVTESWILTRFSNSAQNRAPWFGWSGRKEHAAVYLYMLGPALLAVDDRRLSLVFLHLPIPHPRGIYNRRTREVGADPQSNYFDNLALVDGTLGQIRGALDRSGLADKTALIVTSDHPLRVGMWKDYGFWDKEEADATGNIGGRFVPFLIHLPTAAGGSVYSKPFNTLVTKDLTLAFLEGKITDQSGVAKWLDENDGDGSQSASPQSSQ